MLNKVSKTRALLVNVARTLFAQNGKQNVTMNDIAVASGKGRRTLYTYFNNKDEVYLAVIENELDILVERLSEVMTRNISPSKKLEAYIFTRFEAIKEAVTRNGSLKADFFRNIYEVEKARRPIDIKEIRMLKQIVEAGIADGLFAVTSAQWTSMLMLYALKGIEAPYLNNNIGNAIRDRRPQIMNFIFNGILKKNEEGD
ncbi:MAG: TetR/AcrR family transcriptional regulator [Prevotellaceae bacterium]|jgi:AcrR family transcriptional regulator|nr:TetR/AcrR family transcriptional regulator [Prevotellaceae bacterium]